MSAPPFSLTGAVLAGGESRRMGTDKARLLVEGEELWQRQARVLREAGATPVLIVRRAGQRRFGENLPEVQDTLPGAGPIAGIHAALTAATTEWIAISAVDLPAMTSAWWTRLRGECAAGVGAVGCGLARFEPLAAIYPRSALAEVGARLRDGRHALQDLIRELVAARKMHAVEIAPDERRLLENWNQPLRSRIL